MHNNGHDFKDDAKTLHVMQKHEGVWEGFYLHLDAAGQQIDKHHSRVRCVFPKEGPYAYIQYNHFTWHDGREQEAEFSGVLKDGKLWWDTETFHGCAWQSDGIVLLHLDRKDEPGAYFKEAIILGDNGKYRSRTWHWFKDGQLYRRTLCEETRTSGPQFDHSQEHTSQHK